LNLYASVLLSGPLRRAAGVLGFEGARQVPEGGSLPMLDIAMMILLIGAFIGTAVYIGACDRLVRTPR